MNMLDRNKRDNGAKSQKNWFLIALVSFWAIEILLVQHFSTFPEASIPIDRAIKDAARRLVLNVAACTVLVCWLNRWALRIVFVLGFVAANGVLVYASYFGSPLSWPILSSQWKEGLAVSDHGLSLLSMNALILGTLALVVKILLHWSATVDLPSQKRRFRWGAIGATVYLVIAVSLAVHKPVRLIHMGSPQYIYGYVVAWTAEAISFDNEALLEEALAKADQSSDRLSRAELPLELGKNVVVVQVESLDFDVVDTKVDDAWVMPYLNKISTKSMRYAVKPFHATGSSEADFSLLTTATPNGRVNPFLIHGFPYKNSLPRLAEQQGYQSVSFHGNTGEFFHRRKAYRQMGFSDLYFTEELDPLNVEGKWDDELLQFSAELLEKASEPTFHFVITITSHGPFNRLPTEKRELFPEPDSRQQHYLNSMRYVDRAIQRYVEQLPKETTVVIYGDHESNVHGYCEHESHLDQIPWLIYQQGKDLSVNQKTMASGLALSGDLTQLDMVCYLRDRFASSPAPVDQPAQTTRVAGKHRSGSNQIK